MKKQKSVKSSHRHSRKPAKSRKTKKAEKVKVKKEVLTARQLEEIRLKRLERRREQARLRRRLRNSDRFADTPTAEERAVDVIERSTQCGEGFGRERSKTGLIDLEILAGFADPDELRHEEEICRHCEHVAKHDDDVADGEVEAFLEGGSFEDHDFRDGIKLHDPRRPSHRLKLKNHPECQSDEVYLLSVTPKGFDIIRWETKRMGSKTTCGCHPVFVKRTELTDAGYRLIKPRQAKVRQVA